MQLTWQRPFFWGGRGGFLDTLCDDKLIIIEFTCLNQCWWLWLLSNSKVRCHGKVLRTIKVFNMNYWLDHSIFLQLFNACIASTRMLCTVWYTPSAPPPPLPPSALQELTSSLFGLKERHPSRVKAVTSGWVLSSEFYKGGGQSVLIWKRRKKSFTQFEWHWCPG